MFGSLAGGLGFLAGVGLTVGLLLSPRMTPFPALGGAGLKWSPGELAAAAGAGLLALAVTLWAAGRIIRGATAWREPRVILGTLLIAFVANALFCLLVDLFSLSSGMRALVALLGVPLIYGNLGAVLGRTTLKDSMHGIFTGALATMGGGFILAALLRGW